MLIVKLLPFPHANKANNDHLLTQVGLRDLDLLRHLLDLSGVLRVVPPCLPRLGDLLLEAVPVLVEEVDARAALPPLVVKIDHLQSAGGGGVTNRVSHADMVSDSGIRRNKYTG